MKKTDKCLWRWWVRNRNRRAEEYKIRDRIV